MGYVYKALPHCAQICAAVPTCIKQISSLLCSKKSQNVYLLNLISTEYILPFTKRIAYKRHSNHSRELGRSSCRIFNTLAFMEIFLSVVRVRLLEFGPEAKQWMNFLQSSILLSKSQTDSEEWVELLVQTGVLLFALYLWSQRSGSHPAEWGEDYGLSLGNLKEQNQSEVRWSPAGTEFFHNVSLDSAYLFRCNHR